MGVIIKTPIGTSGGIITGAYVRIGNYTVNKNGNVSLGLEIFKSKADSVLDESSTVPSIHPNTVKSEEIGITITVNVLKTEERETQIVRNVDGVPTTYTITNKVLASNVATLTTSATHALAAGNTVVVTGVDSTFNGTFIVTAVTSNTFSYALVATNVSTTASSGSVNKLIVGDVICDTAEIPQAKTVTLTASGGITS